MQKLNACKDALHKTTAIPWKDKAMWMEVVKTVKKMVHIQFALYCGEVARQHAF